MAATCRNRSGLAIGAWATVVAVALACSSNEATVGATEGQVNDVSGAAMEDVVRPSAATADVGVEVAVDTTASCGIAWNCGLLKCSGEVASTYSLGPDFLTRSIIAAKGAVFLTGTMFEAGNKGQSARIGLLRLDLNSGGGAVVASVKGWQPGTSFSHDDGGVLLPGMPCDNGLNILNPGCSSSLWRFGYDGSVEEIVSFDVSGAPIELAQLTTNTVVVTQEADFLVDGYNKLQRWWVDVPARKITAHDTLNNVWPALGESSIVWGNVLFSLTSGFILGGQKIVMAKDGTTTETALAGAFDVTGALQKTVVLAGAVKVANDYTMQMPRGTVGANYERIIATVTAHEPVATAVRLELQGHALHRFGADASLILSKPLPVIPSGWWLRALTDLANGDYLALVAHGYDESTPLLVVRLSNSFEVIWAKYMLLPNSGTGQLIHRLATVGAWPDGNIAIAVARRNPIDKPKGSWSITSYFHIIDGAGNTVCGFSGP